MIAKKDIEVGMSYSCSISGEKVIVSIVADSETLRNSYDFYKLGSELYFEEKFYFKDFIQCIMSYSFYIVNIFYPKEEKYASCVYLDKYDINRYVKFNSVSSYIFKLDCDKSFLMCKNSNSRWSSFDFVMFYRPAFISDSGFFPVRSVEYTSIFFEKPSSFCLSIEEIDRNASYESIGSSDLSNLRNIYSVISNPGDASGFLTATNFDKFYFPVVFEKYVKLNLYNILELQNKGSLNSRFLPDEFDDLPKSLNLLFNGAFWDYRIDDFQSSVEYSNSVNRWDLFFEFIVCQFGTEIIRLFETKHFNISCSRFLLKDGSICPVFTINFK